MEINEDPSKRLPTQSCGSLGVATSLCAWRGSSIVEKGAPGPSGASVEAVGVGDLGQLTSLCDLLGECIRLSPVGLKLEVRAEIREAVCYRWSPSHLELVAKLSW